MADETHDDTRTPVADNKMGMPISYYSKEFAASDPAVIQARCGIPFDSEQQRFVVHVVGRPVAVHWPDMETVYLDDGTKTSDPVRILMGCLLVEGRLAPATGAFIAYTDIPWGEQYYQQFRGRCIMRIARTFGNNVDLFRRSCEKMGALPAPDGDASYDFEFVDGVFFRLTLWEGDEEFPASSQILFSDNTPLAFQAEALAYAGDVLLGALKAVSKTL